MGNSEKKDPCDKAEASDGSAAQIGAELDLRESDSPGARDALSAMDTAQRTIAELQRKLTETERKLAEALARVEQPEQARDDPALLLQAIEQAGESVVITDVEGNIEYVNPAFERITGYAKADVLGRNPRLLRSGEQGAETYEKLWDTLLAGRTWQGELINRRKDGATYVEAASISPVRNAAGEIAHFVGVKRDISERKAFESSLQENLAFLNALFESIEEGICVVNRDLIIRMTNPVVRRWHGHRLPLEGRHCYDRFWQRDLPCDPCPVQECFTTGKPVSLVKRIQTGSTERWVDIRAYPLRTSDEGPIREVIEFVRDISDRKRAEAQQAMYAAFVQNSSDIIVVKDRQRRVLVTNRAFARAAGRRSVAEMLGKTDAEIFGVSETSEPVQSYAQDDRRALDLPRGEHLMREEPVIFPGGEERTFLTKKFPIQDADGDVFALGIISTDITERKADEVRLRENASRDRSLLDNLPQLIWQKNLNGVYQTCNAAYARSVGLTTDGVVGKTDCELHPSVLAEKYRQDDRDILASGQVATFDEAWVMAGEERFVQTTKVPLFDPMGRLFGTLGIAEDVTDRRRIEQALREREEMYSAIFNQTGDGIVLVDAERLTFVEFNEEACRALGYSRDEFAKLSILDIQGELGAEEIRAQQERINAVGEDSFETLHRHKDGSLRTVDVRKRVLGLRGHRYWVATWRDVTDARAAQQALREEAERRRLMFAHSQDGISVVSFDCRLVEWNQRFADMLGYCAEEMAELHVWDWDRKWSREDLLTLIPTVPATGLTNETRHRRKDGTEYDVEISHSRVEWGGTSYLFSLHRDITERKQAERVLRDSEEFLQGLFDAIQDGISVLNPDLRVVRTNAWMDEHYADRAPLAGRHCYSVFQGRETPCPTCPAAETFTDGRPHREVVPYPNADSPQGWLELSTYPLVDADGRVTQVIEYAKDITTQRRYQQQLEHVALYDPLTDLPNRTLLAERLQQAMARAQDSGRSLALGYLDLDGFKEVNDQHGHDVGDALLVVVADRIRQVLRACDTVARLGGDEFVILLGDFSLSERGSALLRHILSAVAKPIHASELMLQVSGSLGVTLYPQPEKVDADHLLRQADRAMYQAKIQGKNQFQFFDLEEARYLRGQHESLERLHQALQENEFVLYYQPQVNMRSGEVVGVEALVRWQHPTHGLLLPAAFLPVLENQPLGLAVEHWIFQQVLEQMDQWRSQGLALRVNINVSAYQLQQPDFTQRLAEWLRLHPQLDPASLELEVLETSALDDLVAVSRAMRNASQLGVRFALDDFGTGYSSLIYLKLLPAAVLKVDRTFVRDILTDPDDLAILEGIKGMARAFRREVIAEGVETQEQGELLLQLGCELAQGYAIARPMPAEELPGWIASWRPPEAWCKLLQPVDLDDIALLYAGVEHRHWINAIAEFVGGDRECPPSLTPTGCRFGAWLRDEASERFAGSPVLSEIQVLHEQIHRLGGELIETRAMGTRDRSDLLLSELRQQQDALLGKLQHLRHCD